MKITVTVDQACIAEGERGNCAKCPVALAIYKRLGMRCEVDYYNISFGDDRVQTPPCAGTFIVDFDAGRSVEPFTFELDVPNKYVQESMWRKP
jgi:hypothetical protein